ncbi:PREDICTED: uncharacterized protein LOC106121591 [Papilio xuthus]|uniref:Uncharacterized protein LOC106121591 n=1 Tax=Papilio xuthus TaxID=66420 RepID=A0AAJ6ZHL6_PAPXU|nr:PREDICTED: uncharacterized protein LOC106121591 [Papilio xuthus]
MEQAKRLISLQEDRIEQIQKAQSNYLKTPNSRITSSYVETRLDTLERLYCSFTRGHEDLSALILRGQRSSVEYFSLDRFDELDELYTIYKTSLKEKLIELKREMNTSNALSPRTSTSTEIKLPAIQIPTFSGSYTDWPSFRDLFTSIVHKNTTLDNVQKLHYLKSLVAGEAEQLLRSITITNDNYIKAWETLYNRFDNKRYLANSIFKKLFSLKAMAHESAYLLKQLLYTTLDCLNSFKNMGINADAWDDIIVYITVSKLDPTSHQLWEQHITADSEKMPSFQQLHQFLEMRFKALEMVEDNSKQGTSTRCNICKGKHHSLLHPRKREMTTEEQAKHEEEQHTHENENIATHFLKQPGQTLLATALAFKRFQLTVRSQDSVKGANCERSTQSS